MYHYICIHEKITILVVEINIDHGKEISLKEGEPADKTLLLTKPKKETSIASKKRIHALSTTIFPSSDLVK